METAALVISIFAVLLSLIVAGWAIYLQWSMFKATTGQLAAIGKENASLGERKAMSLGQLHETATSTRGSIESTIMPLVSMLRKTPDEQPAAPAATADQQAAVRAWRVRRAIGSLTLLRGTPLFLELLGPGEPPRDVKAFLEEFKARGGDWDDGVLVSGVALALGLFRDDVEEMLPNDLGREVREVLRAEEPRSGASE